MVSEFKSHLRTILSIIQINDWVITFSNSLSYLNNHNRVVLNAHLSPPAYLPYLRSTPKQFPLEHLWNLIGKTSAFKCQFNDASG